jgi:hypothetical protein
MLTGEGRNDSSSAPQALLRVLGCVIWFDLMLVGATTALEIGDVIEGARACGDVDW